jgi:MFS family permease
MVFVLIFFLVDSEYFHMKPDTAMATAAQLLGLSWPFYLVTTLTAGWVFVRFGRRRPIILAYFFGVTGIIILPFIAQTIFPGVYMCLILIQIGAAVTQNTPLMADYIKERSMGSAIAL